MEGFINNQLFGFSSIPDAVFFIFYLVLAGTALMTLVLYYHWARYSVGILSTLGAFVLYSFGAGMLLCSMFLAARGLL